MTSQSASQAAACCIVLLFSFFGQPSSAAVANCTDTSVISDCLKPGQQSWPPATAAEFDSHCQNWKTSKVCLEGFECSLNDETGYRLWRGLVGAAAANTQYFCADDSEARSVYLENGQCILEAVDSTEIAYCAAPASNVDLTNQTAVCIVHNANLRCQYDHVKSKCGNEVADFYTTGLHKAISTALDDYTECTLDISYVGSNSLGVKTVSSVTTYLVLVLIWVLMCRQHYV